MGTSTEADEAKAVGDFYFDVARWITIGMMVEAGVRTRPEEILVAARAGDVLAELCSKMTPEHQAEWNAKMDADQTRRDIASFASPAGSTD